MPGSARRTRFLFLSAATAMVAVGIVGALARAGLRRNREQLLGALLNVQATITIPKGGTLEQGFASALTPWPNLGIAEFALVDLMTAPDTSVTVAMRSPDGAAIARHLHPENAPPRAVFLALEGQHGVTSAPTFRGNAGIVAYAPGPLPGTAIIAVEDAGDLYSPYLRAGIAAATLALVAVLILAIDLGYSERARVLRNQERELRTANESLRALIEAAPLAIVDLDARGRVISIWNPAAERMLGWTREEALGRRLPIVPEDREQEFMALLARSLAGEVILGEKRDRQRKDGSAIRVSIAVGPVRDEGGRADRVMGIISDITDRERQEAELSYQAQVLASVGDAVFATDRVDAITSWNDSAERLFGWRANEVLGLDLQQVLRAVATDGKSGESEVNYLRRDGTPVPVEKTTTAVLGPQEQIVGFVTSARDLTTRRAAEQALAESEARFRRLVDNLPDIVYRIRLWPRLSVEFVGASVFQIAGYTPERFLHDPRSLGRVIHPDDRATLQFHLTHPEISGGRPVLLRWRHADGRTLWLEHRHLPISDEAGRCVAIEGLARDVTETRQSGEERARLAAVIEQADEVVVMTEPDGRIVYVNPAFSRVTGYTREEALGGNPRLLKSGEQGPDFYRELWGQLTQGRPWRGRLKNRRRDGSHYLADVVIAPVKDGDGNTRHYVGLQRDVTDQVARDEALRQAQKMEEIGQLTGGIAHDFNNLLTVILANAALLTTEADGSRETMRPFVVDIQEAARRGATMIRKLLGFSRRERLVPEVLDLEQVVVDLAGTLRRLIPASIEIRVAASEERCRVMADRGAVEQILINLATNARDAMPEGGVLTITLPGPPSDPSGDHHGCLGIAVTDTGVGMDEATQRRVFEPFFTTKPVGKGTGLGMAMVHGLMQQHGGSVTITSAPGDGTTVALWFPTAPICRAPPASASAAETVNGGKERILLVEDEEALRRVGERALQRLGYRVDTAEDGQAALEFLHRCPEGYDLVISDMVMPNLGGRELLACMREQGITSRFLLATGYSEEGAPLDANAAPITVLGKPWSLTDLATEVRRVLDLPRPGARP